MSEPILTLKDLFRLAFSSHVVWLAGDPDARVEVNWVLTSASEIQEGDILVLSYQDCSVDDLQHARSQGVAAVLFVGDGSPPETILPEGLTVASLPGQHNNPQMAQRQLLTVLINQRAALMERGVRIHTQLSQIEAEGRGLGDLVAAMAEISGHGIVVHDKRLALLAEQAPESLKADWQGITARLAQLDTLPESLRDRKLAALHSSIIEQKLDGDLVRLVAPIIVSGMARGYLSLVEHREALTPLDSLVVEQGALVCAVEMSRTKAVREAEKRLKGDLLNALLQENISPRDAQLWAQGMGLDLSQAYTAIRFAWAGPTSPSRRRLETLVNGEVTRLGIPVITSPMGPEIVCFCEVPSGPRCMDAALQFAQGVVDQGFNEYPDSLVICGLGAPSQDINEWRLSFRQAGQALELARRFREHRPRYFPDLSVYRLLLQLEHNPELSTFQEETFGTLMAVEGGRELIRTLEAYFEHNGNLSQTAEALFIHRNTLIYRMERVASITGLDLDNAETRLALQLALHIYRMTIHTRT